MTAEQAAQAKCYADTAGQMKPVHYILHIIPDSVVGAFISNPEGGLCRAGRPSIFQIGDVLQVLFFAVLFGFTLMKLGERGGGDQRARRRSRACDVRRDRNHQEGGAAFCNSRRVWFASRSAAVPIRRLTCSTARFSLVASIPAGAPLY